MSEVRPIPDSAVAPDRSPVRKSPDGPHRSTVGTWIPAPVAVCLPALLYVLYIFHYAVNVPYADDWNMIPLVTGALHGHLTIGELWAQYVAGRPFVARLVLVAFGAIDNLNERSVMLFSASIFIASFVFVLVLFRSYLRRPLTFVPVLSLGIVWFSWADLSNALFSLQLVVFLEVFFFAVMAFFLLGPHHHRKLFFALGLVAALLASLSFLQGFVAWPVGLICLVWVSPWGRRTYYESAIWVLAATITLVFYLHGYLSGDSSCLAEGGRREACSPTFGLLHPFTLLRYFIVLVGDVIPTSLYSLDPRYLLIHELLGTVLCIVAGVVIVQSIRERRSRATPLPLVLVAFALLFDVMIALGHLGEGLPSAGIARFALPNLILLVGILVFAWGHVPGLRPPQRDMEWRERLKIVALLVLSIFLVVQCVATSQFGIAKGKVIHQTNVTIARVAVNLDRIPSARQPCYFGSVVIGTPFFLLKQLRDEAKRNHLSVFQLSTRRTYRAEGPPAIAQCNESLHIATTSLPTGKVGVRYSATLIAAGGTSPYVWSTTTAGPLPKGLNLDALTGVISGTPRVSGVGVFSVTVAERDTKEVKRASHATYPRTFFINISRG